MTGQEATKRTAKSWSDARRDWGYTGVRAMWLMLRQDKLDHSMHPHR